MSRNIRLVVFDLDGTLTTVDSLWEYLHRAFGTWDRGKVMARKYRGGEITYQQWAEADAACWAGISLSEVDRALKDVAYREGAKEVFQELREREVRTAIVSAGLSLLADRAAKDLGADSAYSNELEANDGHLTGRITVKVAVNNKREVIEQITSQLGLSLRQVALVGDRSFDLSHPECLKIAFKPKDSKARQEADAVVEDDLPRILQYLH